jgi:chromosome segregation ATPase
MEGLTNKLKRLKAKAIVNNQYLEILVTSIRRKLAEMTSDSRTTIDDLQRQITTYETNANPDNPLINSLREKLQEKENEIRLLKDVSEEIDTIINSIQDELNNTNDKILNANVGFDTRTTFEPDYPEDYTGVPEVADANLRDRLGGKSTKRKRHHKKHSKGKSRNIRNKKHKSK